MKFEFITEQRCPRVKNFAEITILHGFQDIIIFVPDGRIFPFPAKVQDGHPKLPNLNILIIRNLNLSLPCRSKICLK